MVLRNINGYVIVIFIATGCIINIIIDIMSMIYEGAVYDPMEHISQPIIDCSTYVFSEVEFDSIVNMDDNISECSYSTI